MTVPDPLFRLDGKVALVTGGYGGIGAPVCQALCARGARVGVAGHDAGKAGACAATLRAEGYDSWSDAFDARSQPETERLVEAATAHFGRLDILINLVGGQREEKTGEVTAANFDEVIALNLKSAMFQGQAAARQMIQQNSGGKLLFFGSVRSQLALRGRGFAAYCAAKGGLSVLTKQLAAELAEHRVNVNALAPTFNMYAAGGAMARGSGVLQEPRRADSDGSRRRNERHRRSGVVFRVACVGFHHGADALRRRRHHGNAVARPRRIGVGVIWIIWADVGWGLQAPPWRGLKPAPHI